MTNDVCWVRTAVLIVALLVSNHLGGMPQAWEADVGAEAHIASIKARLNSNIVPLGALRRGV